MELQVADEVTRVHLDCEMCRNELSRTEDVALAGRQPGRRIAAEREWPRPSSTGRFAGK